MTKRKVKKEARSPERFEEALRVADLVCQPDPAELLALLPNAKARDAQVVEDRLRKAVPEAASGVVVRDQGDKVETLLKRARGAVEASAPSASS